MRLTWCNWFRLKYRCLGIPPKWLRAVVCTYIFNLLSLFKKLQLDSTTTYAYIYWPNSHDFSSLKYHFCLFMFYSSLRQMTWYREIALKVALVFFFLIVIDFLIDFFLAFLTKKWAMRLAEARDSRVPGGFYHFSALKILLHIFPWYKAWMIIHFMQCHEWIKISFFHAFLSFSEKF